MGNAYILLKEHSYPNILELSLKFEDSEKFCDRMHPEPYEIFILIYFISNYLLISS